MTREEAIKHLRDDWYINNGQLCVDGDNKDPFLEAVGMGIKTLNAVPVVRCKDCVTHGNCLTEDTFRIARIENPFCCGGKRREAEHDE